MLIRTIAIKTRRLLLLPSLSPPLAEASTTTTHPQRQRRTTTTTGVLPSPGPILLHRSINRHPLTVVPPPPLSVPFRRRHSLGSSSSTRFVVRGLTATAAAGAWHPQGILQRTPSRRRRASAASISPLGRRNMSTTTNDDATTKTTMTTTKSPAAAVVVQLTLTEIHSLSHTLLLQNKCDVNNALAIADTITLAERDGALSHGLFRLRGYITSLQGSKKVNGSSKPTVEQITPSSLRVDGDGGFAPYALQIGLPPLIASAKSTGIAVMSVTNVYHFAALYPEVEEIARHNLVGMACTTTVPFVAVHGSSKGRPFLGTNPMAFAYPRVGSDGKEENPFVFDMATSAKAHGDIGIAAREGHALPLGIGLNADGQPTTDAREIHEGGVLLPFGGYKGSALSIMIELLSAGLTGENFSYERGEEDNDDGGPSRGGEFVMALSPAILAGRSDWMEHSEEFLEKLGGMEGVRVPGQRRFENRRRGEDVPRDVNAELVEELRGMLM